MQTAEDFHDDIGNKLTRIIILADLLDRKMSNQNDEQKQIVTKIRENAENLYKDANDILWSVDPKNDNLSKVLDRIKYFAIDLFNNTDTNVVLDDFKVEKDLNLSVELIRNINMIFKELLYNIFKHAGAETVKLTSRADEEKINLVVSDDGKGFHENSEIKGRGLANIKKRARRINGSIEIETLPGMGTKTSLTIYRQEFMRR